MTRLLVLWMVLVLTACSDTQSEDRMAAMANATQYVASTLHGLVRYDRAPDDADSAALLALVRKTSPKTLVPLKSYTLRARQDGGFSSVLICDVEGRHALVEDAGCSHETDARLWSQQVPCAFRLDLPTVCSKP